MKKYGIILILVTYVLSSCGTSKGITAKQEKKLKMLYEASITEAMSPNADKVYDNLTVISPENGEL
ncbi:MAG: hypothetical protein AAF617_18345, partial [Bacteroidota bacterium]